MGALYGCRVEVIEEAKRLLNLANERGYKKGWVYYELLNQFRFLADPEWHFLAGILEYNEMWAIHKVKDQRNEIRFNLEKRESRVNGQSFDDYWKQEYDKYREAYKKATGVYPDSTWHGDDQFAYDQGVNETARNEAHQRGREQWAKSHTHKGPRDQKQKQQYKSKAAGSGSSTSTKRLTREEEALKLLKIIKPYTRQEVKSAFRAAAKKWHPDMDGGDAAKFRAVNDAYTYLMGLLG